MSAYSARIRRRRTHAAGASRVIIILMVVLVLVLGGAIAGSTAYVLNIAHGVHLSDLKPRTAGSVSVVYAERWPRSHRPARVHQVRRAAHGADGAGDEAEHPRRDGRDRGRALLQAQGRRLPGPRPRRRQQRAEPQGRAGRLDADDAADPQHLHARPQAHLQAQDRGGVARPAAREAPSRAHGQGVHPHPVPQQRALRHDARRLAGDRHPGRGARVLRRGGEQADAASGRAAGRTAAGTDRV